MMKFLNPETGHGADGIISAKCSAWPTCVGCPAAEIALEDGLIGPCSCTEFTQKHPEELPRIMAAIGYYPMEMFAPAEQPEQKTYDEPAETFLERLEREHPETAVGFMCPCDFGYEKERPEECDVMTCAECWGRVIPSEEETEEKKVEEIKEGDVVRLKKEVIEAGSGRIYNCVMMTDKILDALGDVKLVTDGRKPGTAAWKVRRLYDESLRLYFVGEDALELVQHTAVAKSSETPETNEAPAETPNAEEAEVVRTYRRLAAVEGHASISCQPAILAGRICDKITKGYIGPFDGYAMLRDVAIEGAIVARFCANEIERDKEDGDVEF